MAASDVELLEAQQLNDDSVAGGESQQRSSPKIKRIAFFAVGTLALGVCAYGLASKAIGGGGASGLLKLDAQAIESKAITCTGPATVTTAGVPTDCSDFSVPGNYDCTGTSNGEDCSGSIVVGGGLCPILISCNAPVSFPTDNGQQSTSDGGSCFPGDSRVHVKGVGLTAMSDLRFGDEVLSEGAMGELVHEPVLGFLHRVLADNSKFITIAHANGEFRATANHLVFVQKDGKRVSKATGEIQAGDYIIASDESTKVSKVYAVKESTTQLGMFAPLTASGAVVVDGVVASIYAKPSSRAVLTHSMAHAALFPVRAVHAMGIHNIHKRVMRQSTAPVGGDELHPFVGLLWKNLRLDKIIQ